MGVEFAYNILSTAGKKLLWRVLSGRATDVPKQKQLPRPLAILRSVSVLAEFMHSRKASLATIETARNENTLLWSQREFVIPSIRCHKLCLARGSQGRHAGGHCPNPSQVKVTERSPGATMTPFPHHVPNQGKGDSNSMFSHPFSRFVAEKASFPWTRPSWRKRQGKGVIMASLFGVLPGRKLADARCDTQ